MLIIITSIYTTNTCGINIVISFSKSIPIADGAYKYQPKKWNNNKFLYKSTNCYAYALNFIKHPVTNVAFSSLTGYYGIEVGSISGNFTSDLLYDDYEIKIDTISKLFKADMQKIGYKTKKISKKNIYKKIKSKKDSLVYLITTSNSMQDAYFDNAKRLNIIMEADYHWYRQDKNGKWSHKRGYKNKITQNDSSSKCITNPQKARKVYYDYHINPKTGSYIYYDIDGKTYQVVSVFSYDGDSRYFRISRK